ncbi:FYVE-domain-containing protein [Backusella circina FSU 941]|nr:FYVE-domain-containing protein [Backusella circina FSU 941]
MNYHHSINEQHSNGVNIDTHSSNNGQRSLGRSKSMSNQIARSPTREHWKLDKEVDQCEMGDCNITFTLFERRHHCRKCGDIFCSRHSSNYFRLNKEAGFHTNGTLCRGCDTCADEYSVWQNKQTNEREDVSRNNRRMSAPSPKGDIMTRQSQDMEGVVELGREDVVQPRDIIQSKKDKAFQPIPSVPADWQWSTF